VRIVSVLDEGYPSNLRIAHQRPPVVFVRGGSDERDEMSVAVVGTRHPTTRGPEQASMLAAGLVERGIPVVSGLAAGIDTAAHRAALAGGRRTVAVIGTGIDRVYPPQDADLQEEIASRGMVLSQFLPGSAPSKISFPDAERGDERVRAGHGGDRGGLPQRCSDAGPAGVAARPARVLDA